MVVDQFPPQWNLIEKGSKFPPQWNLILTLTHLNMEQVPASMEQFFFFVDTFTRVARTSYTLNQRATKKQFPPQWTSILTSME